MDAAVGVTAIDRNTTAAVTVSVTPGLVIPVDAAVMTVVPGFTPVAIPVAAIVAAFGAEDAQVTPVDRVWLVPSLNVPVAVNCCVAPDAIDAPAGVTTIDCNVAAVPVPVRETVCGLPVPV
jgi:hypothetical protein